MLTKILLMLAVLLAVVAVVAVTVGYVISAPRYRGPASDHFDGDEFINPDGAKAKGFREVIGWLLTRHRTPWDAYHNVPFGPKPPARVPDGAASGRELRVTFVNHSTVLLQFDHLNVLTDPVYSERVSPFQFAGPKRNRPPGIRFADLPKIDILLLSHNHWDHLDISTAKKLCDRDRPEVYCPLGVKAFLEAHKIGNVTEMDWGQSAQFNPSTTVHCVPAQHFSGRGLFDRNATLWAGYVLDSRVAGRLYFAGDSGYGPFFRQTGARFGPLRLALLPIGAYKPPWFMSPIHCSPAEAVRMHQDVRAEQSVAIHYGAFPLADDGEREPVDDLRKALVEAGIPADRFRALQEGVGVEIE